MMKINQTTYQSEVNSVKIEGRGAGVRQNSRGFLLVILPRLFLCFLVVLDNHDPPFLLHLKILSQLSHLVKSPDDLQSCRSKERNNEMLRSEATINITSWPAPC